ncbi:unnamed protein product [Symbiodinium natans]|uniref:Uncharacterized protein n=1 Tax=Symbiodinium natans TaxID=878477 RepID=A0A812KD64_9DINO|nr:unnamed protein product [Symbiodinium natans]
MARIPVAGSVLFKDGSAYLRISPKSGNMATSNFPDSGAGSSSSTPNPPWPISTQRSDQQILEAINSGAAIVHHTRLPMNPTDLRVMLNNIQTALGLTVGVQGDWSPRADQRLLDVLLKPKRSQKRKAAAINAIEDAPASPKAIQDKPTGNMNSEHPENTPSVNAIEDAPTDSAAVQSEPTGTTHIVRSEAAVDDLATADNTPSAEDNATSHSNDGNDSDSSSSSSSRSSISLAPPDVNTMKWTSDFADAYTSAMDLFIISGDNKKKKNASAKVLHAIVKAKGVFDSN